MPPVEDSTTAWMPVYHGQAEEVRAFRIALIQGPVQYGGAMLVPMAVHAEPVFVDQRWVIEQQPSPGGYYVRRDDDRAWYLPAARFEREYRCVG